jgi:cyanophycin synthetase
MPAGIVLNYIDKLNFNSHLCRTLTVRVMNKISRLTGRLKTEQVPLALNNRIIREGAEAIGCHVQPLANGFLKLSLGTQVHYCRSSDCDFESVIAWQLCGDKSLTLQILGDNGLPVPPYICLKHDQIELAYRFMTAQDGPVVTKPSNGAGGVGVTTSIQTRSGLIRGLAEAYACSFGELMVERHVEGRHYRVTILEDEILSIIERHPARVTGDGRSSIRTLINNANSLAGQPGNQQIRLIPLDRETDRCLREQSQTLASVPTEGGIIYLRTVCNADQGGEITDVNTPVHNDYLELARSAARAVGAKLAGVDLIALNIGVAIEPGSCWINEVNTTPALYIVEAPNTLKTVNVGEKIVRRIFAEVESLQSGCLTVSDSSIRC